MVRPSLIQLPVILTNMLTPKEFDQLDIAIQIMHTFRINDADYVSKNNVLILLGKFVEDKEAVLQAKGLKTPSTGSNGQA
jgi:hypothetical protein